MKWFDLPDDLISELRRLQEFDAAHNELLPDQDAVVMFLGLGSARYLTFDGRVIIDDWMDDEPPREATTLREAASAVLVGAKQRDLPMLLDLLPPRPANGQDCGDCDEGWNEFKEGFEIVCHSCGGLGWKALDSDTT